MTDYKNHKFEFSKANSRTRRKYIYGYKGDGTNKREIKVTSNLEYSRSPLITIEIALANGKRSVLFAQARRFGLYGKHIGSKPMAMVQRAVNNYIKA